MNLKCLQKLVDGCADDSILLSQSNCKYPSWSTWLEVRFHLTNYGRNYPVDRMRMITYLFISINISYKFL